MKILVVDDNVDVGVVLGIALRRLGHVSLLAARADDAVAMLTPDVDAVITDIEMPMMDGVELARAVRDYDMRIPIAFCTGSDHRHDRVVAASGFGPVYGKRWTVDSVRGIVDELATRRAQLLRARRDRRYRVRLKVSYGSARDFCIDYTENLSEGGMFVRGALHLAEGQDVDVQLSLPEGQTYDIAARVAFLLDDMQATRLGRSPGAGLEILTAPPSFHDELRDALERLESRKHFVVLASDGTCRRVIEEAGYTSADVPPAPQLAAELEDPELPVIGVVVGRREEAVYRAAVSSIGASALVHGIDFIEELDAALATFDVGLLV